MPTNKFRAPAEKYVGQVKIYGGPVPLQQWHKPYTPDQRNRPLGAEGVDLHPERKEMQKEPPAALKKRKGG